MISTSNRSQVEWVSIEEVIPNPLNPRKDDAIKTKEMQAIIKRRGWEEPLTVYKKGQVYVVLSGHRRLFSAKKAGIKEIPIFVVEAPANYQEEIERIASLQSGRVDWTPFEWARFTHERWTAWGKPTINSFSKKIGINKRTAEQYIKVLEVFPIPEIESGLKYGILSFSILYQAAEWIKKLEDSFPYLVSTLTKDLIRKVIIDKCSSKLVDRDSLRRTEIFSVATAESIREFLISRDMKLEDLLLNYNIDTKSQTFHGSMVSLGLLKKTVKAINPRTEEQYSKSVESLKEIKNYIESKIKEIESKQEKQLDLVDDDFKSI